MDTRKFAINEINFDGTLTVVATYDEEMMANGHLILASRMFPRSRYQITVIWG